MNIKKSLLVIAVSVSSTIVVANLFLGWQDPSEEGDIPVGAQIMIWAWVIGWVIFLWKKSNAFASQLRVLCRMGSMIVIVPVQRKHSIP